MGGVGRAPPGGSRSTFYPLNVIFSSKSKPRMREKCSPETHDCQLFPGGGHVPKPPRSGAPLMLRCWHITMPEKIHFLTVYDPRTLPSETLHGATGLMHVKEMETVSKGKTVVLLLGGATLFTAANMDQHKSLQHFLAQEEGTSSGQNNVNFSVRTIINHNSN